MTLLVRFFFVIVTFSVSESSNAPSISFCSTSREMPLPASALPFGYFHIRPFCRTASLEETERSKRVRRTPQSSNGTAHVSIVFLRKDDFHSAYIPCFWGSGRNRACLTFI